jgi:hypothetical protein
LIRFNGLAILETPCISFAHSSSTSRVFKP